MKNLSCGSFTKLLAAIIIGVVFIFLIGTAANGWQKTNNEDNNSDEVGGSSDGVDESNGDTDGNEGTVDNNTQNNPEEPQAPAPPEITSYLTGLETTAELAGKLPFVFVAEPNAPLYGISGSELTVEIPTESGNTRFLIYRTDISNLGKIGAISKSRDYISQTAKFYGGILVAQGKDDIVKYSSVASTLHVDLTEHSEYIYKENGKNLYTDYQNLVQIVKKEGIDFSKYTSQSIPFEFCDYFDTVTCKTSANKLVIPYSGNETKLLYDLATGDYLLSKAGRDKVDMLDGKVASYKNVFILFADTVTYETSAGTQTVVNTATSGSGYYASCGKLIEIRWSSGENGELIFKDLNGSKLVVNRGNSYVGYYKASDSESVVFE